MSAVQTKMVVFGEAVAYSRCEMFENRWCRVMEQLNFMAILLHSRQFWCFYSFSLSHLGLKLLLISPSLNHRGFWISKQERPRPDLVCLSTLFLWLDKKPLSYSSSFTKHESLPWVWTWSVCCKLSAYHTLVLSLNRSLKVFLFCTYSKAAQYRLMVIIQSEFLSKVLVFEALAPEKSHVHFSTKCCWN